MKLKLSTIRPIIKDLHRQGYEKMPTGQYQKTFVHRGHAIYYHFYQVTLEELASASDGHVAFLVRAHIEVMKKIAEFKNEMESSGLVKNEAIEPGTLVVVKIVQDYLWRNREATVLEVYENSLFKVMANDNQQMILVHSSDFELKEI